MFVQRGVEILSFWFYDDEYDEKFLLISACPYESNILGLTTEWSVTPSFATCEVIISYLGGNVMGNSYNRSKKHFGSLS